MAARSSSTGRSYGLRREFDRDGDAARAPRDPQIRSSRPPGVGPAERKILVSPARFPGVPCPGLVPEGIGRAIECAAMVERVVLHLGLHKTGTTSIQAALVDAFEDLIERGVLYPRAGRSGPGHALLPEEIEYTDGPVTEVPTHVAILEEVRRSRPNTVLISAEDLNRADRPRLLEWARAFCHELSPAHVDLLVYVRPQWEFIEAIYAERTKTGTAWGIFEDFL